MRAVAADGDVGQFDSELEQPVGDPRTIAVGDSTGQHLGSVTTMPARALTGMTVGVEEDVSMIELEVLQADVTKLEVDAITNAANTELRHGGGVAAAISRAGGPAVQRESNEKAPIGLGEAVETTAGEMPARYVIHAATMELGEPTSADIITRATRSTLRTADELGCRSLALVAFGYRCRRFPAGRGGATDGRGRATTPAALA